MFDLPQNYTQLTPQQRRAVRLQYIEDQDGKCMFCECELSGDPAATVKSKRVNTRIFPKGFFNYPIHLQHCHRTGMTEGAVHAHCNAVLWQYHGR